MPKDYLENDAKDSDLLITTGSLPNCFRFIFEQAESIHEASFLSPILRSGSSAVRRRRYRPETLDSDLQIEKHPFTAQQLTQSRALNHLQDLRVKSC